MFSTVLRCVGLYIAKVHGVCSDAQNVVINHATPVWEGFVRRSCLVEGDTECDVGSRLQGLGVYFIFLAERP